MLKIILARLQQGHQTMKYPDGPPPKLSGRFRGHPVLDAGKCRKDCRACVEANMADPRHLVEIMVTACR